MSDSYQAIYDAVRSRISGGNVEEAVYRAVRDSGVSHAAEMISRAWQQAAWDQSRPSAIYKPAVYPDGDQWCALYGDDIQTGIVGFGKTPHEAVFEFDRAWESAETPDAMLARKIREEEAREHGIADGQFGVGA